MRLLLCGPGASWATHDVYTGLLAGLKATGHLVEEYALGARLNASRVLLEYLWRKQCREGGPLKDVRPNAADVQYHAGQGLLERALRFEPDWVVVVCAAYLHPDVLILARRAGLRLAAVFTESPYDDAEQAKVAPLFDVCFTNERTSVDVLRRANPETHYLPAAYDPATHGPQADPGPAGEQPDVVFVGTGFASRVELLSQVDWRGIDLRLFGWWEDVGAGHPLLPYVHKGLIDNARAGQVYRRAKLALNLYRRPRFGARAESLNPRAYELAADGVFTISQHRAEVAQKFGQLVPEFHSPKQLEGLVRHHLRDEKARTAAGRCLAGLVAHDTYQHRAARLVAHLGAQD